MSDSDIEKLEDEYAAELEKNKKYLAEENKKFEAKEAEEKKLQAEKDFNDKVDKLVAEKVDAFLKTNKPGETSSDVDSAIKPTGDGNGEELSMENLKAQNDKLQEELKKLKTTSNDPDPVMGNDSSGNQLGGIHNDSDSQEQKIMSASLKRWSKIQTSYEERGRKISIQPNSYTNENFMKAYVEYGREALYNFDNMKFDNAIFKATDPDASCPLDTSDWEVVDCFVNEIWFSVLCKSDFLGKIGHRKYDYNAGCGMKLQIRLLTIASPSQDWTDTSSSTPCDCLTCVSDTLSTYSVTIEKYGDYRVLCDEHFMRAGEELRSAIISAMKKRLAERIDNRIYTNLEAATPGYTQDLAAACGGSRLTDGLCCTYAVDLYDKIISLEADMREAGYFADADPVLIVSPTVARYLKFKDGLNIPPYMAGQIKVNGMQIVQIGNIKVIESCHANSCVTDADEVQAILIDPSRAFCEVWAKQPLFEFKREPKCGSEDVVVWAYGAFDVLDTNAIGHIVNP